MYQVVLSISMCPDQAETDQRQLARAEQRAALEAQAAALSAKMAESHLAVFRAEAKNRRAPCLVTCRSN